MAVLIIHDNQNLSDIYASNIKVYTNQDVVIHSKVHEGLNFLKEAENVHAVVTKKKVDEHKAFEKTYKALSGQLKDILLICLDRPDRAEFYPEVTILEGESDLKNLIKIIAQKVGVTAQMMANLKMPDYFPFESRILIPSLSYDVDIFDKEGDSYNLIFPEGKKVNNETCRKLQKKKSEFYVKSLDRLSLINGLTDNIITTLKSDELSNAERIQVTESGFEMVQNTVHDLGIDEGTIELADTTVESMKRSVQSCKSVKMLMEHLFANDSSFKYQHSMTTLYIGTKIIEEAEWGSKELLKKLAFVCMFADSSLVDDNLARIQTEAELAKMDLTDEEKELVMNHPLKSAKIVAKFNKLPMGVETLVKQHHGTKRGIGLEMDTYNIAPAGLVYMISSEFAVATINAREKNLKINKNKFMSYLKGKYEMNPKFKQYIWYFGQIKL